jgi:hypothetical protein
MISGPVGLTANSFNSEQVPPGKLHLVVEVSIENLGSGPLGYSPAYFRVTDASGASYPAGAPGTNLPASSGPPGLLARANVAFEAPVGARGFTLVYEPTPAPNGYQTLKIALGA